MATTQLRELAPGVHICDGSQRFFGMEMGARMTVLELDGGLLVHSPLALAPESIAHLGDARWALAPNLFHHLYVGPWQRAGLDAWAAPGLEQKRDDVAWAGVIGRDPVPFGSDVELFAISCFDMTNEAVLLHRPSRTLVVTDLVFNIPPSAPWFTRLCMRTLGGYPGCRTTALERWKMQRDRAREDIARILAWDFDRVIMAHGEVIETGGKDAIARAFGWLGTTPRLAG